MTCKDCVSYDVCKKHYNEENSALPDLFDLWLNPGICSDFKNKADVVPVEWISVKDRLPDKNGKCLCAEYSKAFNRHFIEVLGFAKDLHKVDEFEFKNKKGKSGFYDYDSEWGYTEYENVTHWMPLPELPEKEGADND